MQYVGTYNTAAEAGAAILSGGWDAFGVEPDVAAVLDYNKAVKEGNDEWVEELCIEAITSVENRCVIIDEESREIVSIGMLVMLLDGSMRFEMWGTNRPNPLHVAKLIARMDAAQ